MPRALLAGTFAKLALLTLSAIAPKLIFLDNDCLVLRNIDHLAHAPTPAACVHAADDGINSGVMVIAPDEGVARDALAILRTATPPRTALLRSERAVATSDFGDQEVWTGLLAQRNQTLSELPAGYNFRWHVPMAHEERCQLHIVHGWFSTRRSPELLAEFHDRNCQQGVGKQKLRRGRV